MPGYPKPEKKERGRTKDGREKRRRSAPQWKGHEREDARWLQNTYGEDGDPVFRAAKTSTGRVGHIVALGFDSTSQYAIGESKDHKLPKWITDLWVSAQSCVIQEEVELPTWIRDAWAQLNQAAHGRVGKRRPVLFLSYGKDQNPTFSLDGKQVKLPEMHIIDRDHHTELVKGWLGLEGVREALMSDASDADKLEFIADIVKDAS